MWRRLLHDARSPGPLPGRQTSSPTYKPRSSRAPATWLHRPSPVFPLTYLQTVAPKGRGPKVSSPSSQRLSAAYTKGQSQGALRAFGFSDSGATWERGSGRGPPSTPLPAPTRSSPSSGTDTGRHQGQTQGQTQTDVGKDGSLRTVGSGPFTMNTYHPYGGNDVTVTEMFKW